MVSGQSWACVDHGGCKVDVRVGFAGVGPRQLVSCEASLEDGIAVEGG